LESPVDFTVEVALTEIGFLGKREKEKRCREHLAYLGSFSERDDKSIQS
jgi:hypothetical protein